MSSTGEPSAVNSLTDLMDRVYRFQRHIYNPSRRFFLLGRDHLIAALDPPADGAVLEIGCGTGRNLIAGARRYKEARFFGLDISLQMLATARASIARAGLQNRITLMHGDAADFDATVLFGRSRFDRVFVSYTLSMTPTWREALGRAADCISPDGRLHLIDFGSQEHLPAWFEVLLRRWLGRFHVAPRGSLAQTVTMVAGRRSLGTRIQSLYRGYALYAELGRQ